MPSVTITEANNATQVSLSVGDVAEIHLEENPTTGFRWSIDELSPGLDVIDDKFHIAGTPLVAGASGVHEWRLRVAEPGSHTLRLRLAQEWERESAADRRFTVDIVAE
ncbi:MAG: protease inhibitor I42 family protein [bacterium]|nr:protease inhibitor I42 family protein [bacterium]